MKRGTVLYDDDCGLCRWSAERLRRWDRHGRLRFRPLNAQEADDALGHLTDRERYASWHFVDTVGRVSSAAAAVPEVLKLLPGGGTLAALARALPGTTDRLYRWVADHRDGIGRLLGPEACAVDPSGRGRDRRARD